MLAFSISIYAQKMGKQSLAQLKESPAGSKIVWFMDAIKLGEEVSDEVMEAQFAPKLIEKMGIDNLKNAIADLQQNEGQLSLYSAKRVKMTQYRLKVKGKKSGEWFEMLFYFEESEPFRMLGFTMDSVEEGNDTIEPIYPN